MLSWPLGVTAGYFIGSAIPDPKTFGLDAIFPAILIALTFSALKNKVTRKAAFAGSTLALITTSFLAAGLPILISLFGLIWGRKNESTVTDYCRNSSTRTGYVQYPFCWFSLRCQVFIF